MHRENLKKPSVARTFFCATLYLFGAWTLPARHETARQASYWSEHVSVRDCDSPASGPGGACDLDAEAFATTNGMVAETNEAFSAYNETFAARHEAYSARYEAFATTNGMIAASNGTILKSRAVETPFEKTIDKTLEETFGERDREMERVKRSLNRFERPFLIFGIGTSNHERENAIGMPGTTAFCLQLSYMEMPKPRARIMSRVIARAGAVRERAANVSLKLMRYQAVTCHAGPPDSKTERKPT